METSEEERVLVARREARTLGYQLFVDEAPNIQPVRHVAWAAPYIEGHASVGRFVAYGTSAAEAAERGVDVLRGIVERGDAWPESESS